MLAKPVADHLHLRERIVAMRVEARRDEHEPGSKAANRRLDDVANAAQYSASPDAGGERDVHDVLGSNPAHRSPARTATGGARP